MTTQQQEKQGFWRTLLRRDSRGPEEPEVSVEETVRESPVEAPEFFAAGTTGTLGFGFTLTYALAALGWLVFGIATFRARVYPRAAAVVLVVGAALTFAPLPASGVVLDVAVAWLGLSLLSQKDAFAGQPERVK